MEDLENDYEVRVIVFDSAVNDFFIARFDMLHGTDILDIPGAAPITELPHFMDRLARSPVASIASIRGCIRGIGSEFILACEMRFASIEKAIFGQPEVGIGVTIGGGGMEWLVRLLGRSRALEIAFTSEDFTATVAERYG